MSPEKENKKMVALTKDQIEIMKRGSIKQTNHNLQTTKVPRPKNEASASEVLEQLETKIKDMQQSHETKVDKLKSKISTCDTEIAELQAALIKQAQE